MRPFMSMSGALLALFALPVLLVSALSYTSSADAPRACAWRTLSENAHRPRRTNNTCSCPGPGAPSFPLLHMYEARPAGATSQRGADSKRSGAKRAGRHGSRTAAGAGALVPTVTVTTHPRTSFAMITTAHHAIIPHLLGIARGAPFPIPVNFLALGRPSAS